MLIQHWVVVSGSARGWRSGETNPCRRPNEEATDFLAVPRHGEPDDHQEIIEAPQEDNEGVDGRLGRGVVPHDGQIRMQCDGCDEQARCQVARLDKPPLHPAGCCPNLDPIAPDPDGVQQERGCLVDVGQQEVVDEDEELVGVCFFLAEGLAVLAVVAHVVALSEAQGQINGRRGQSRGGVAGSLPGPEMPSYKLDGEIQQHHGGGDEREGGQDGDCDESLAMNCRKRAEVVA